MKKFTLLFAILLFAVAASFAQDRKVVQALKPSHLLDRKLSASFSGVPAAQQPHKKLPVTRGGTIVYDTLGTAANAYTTLEPGSTDVYADNNTNTVIFIHRNDDTKFEHVISHYRYDISNDGGNNWTLNKGPLNPNCKDSVGWYNSRFPQAVIYNPSPTSSNQVDSSYLAYLGSWHDNTNSSNNSIWNGIITGVQRLDGASSTRTENDLTPNNANTLIASALTKGLPGEFWAVDQEQSGGTNDSIIIVYKGVWNNTTKDVDWNLFARLNPNFYDNGGTTSKLTPMIAFDPTGMMGWIGSCGDFGGDLTGTLTPFFYNTTDGGQTWNGPYVANTLDFPCVMSSLSPNSQSNVPVCGFDLDLAVDKNGTPHLVTTVGSVGGDFNHDIESGLGVSLFDFSYNADSGTWNAINIYQMTTFRGKIGGGSEGDYTQDNRPQLSLSPDGSKIIYLWTDSPVNPGGDNNVPDLLGIGYDVNANKWTVVDTFTAVDNTWGGQSAFPSVSPIALKTGSATYAPTVITKLDPTLDPTLPASFFYFEGIGFDDDAYTQEISECKVNAVKNITKADANISMYPNPANDVVFISAPSQKLQTATINVYNVLGELVYSDKNRNNSTYTLSTKSLTNGIYTITIVNGNSVSSKQLIVNHN